VWQLMREREVMRLGLSLSIAEHYKLQQPPSVGSAKGKHQHVSQRENKVTPGPLRHDFKL